MARGSDRFCGRLLNFDFSSPNNSVCSKGHPYFARSCWKQTISEISGLLAIASAIPEISFILTSLKFVICRLKLIFTTVPATSKNDARFKSGQI